MFGKKIQFTGLFRRNKNTKLLVTRQILNLIPAWLLDTCIKTYQSDKGLFDGERFELIDLYEQ